MPQDACQPIRDKIETLEKEIAELEELLPELPPSKQPLIKRIIEDMKRRLSKKRLDLVACEEGERPGS
jgi:hypothetical protein